MFKTFGFTVLLTFLCGTSAARTTVTVVGAGVSGLTAAQFLTRNNFEVVVVEARNRIGGRIWTDRSLSMPIDLGASWIHGAKKNPLFKMANACGFHIVFTDNEAWPDVFTEGGRALSLDERVEADKIFWKIIERAQAKQENLSSGEDRALGAALEKAISRKKLSAAEELQVRHLFATEIENDYATDTANLSLRHWDRVRWFKGGDFLLPGGYDQIVNRLASGLNIRLETEITRIEYGDWGVNAVASNGTSLRSDYLIVTLPLGVLKEGSVAFSPPLPHRKQTAIQNLGVGVFDKVILKFPTAFWSSEAVWIEHSGKDARQWPMFLNLQKSSGQPVLAAFVVGSFAQELEGKADAAIVDDVMAVLRTMYGPGIPAPIQTLVTHWGTDPYALGAYSYIPPGGAVRDLDILGEPVQNRLFFAGEATSRRDNASAHAGYLSGIRVGKEVLSVE